MTSKSKNRQNGKGKKHQTARNTSKSSVASMKRIPNTINKKKHIFTSKLPSSPVKNKITSVAEKLAKLKLQSMAQRIAYEKGESDSNVTTPQRYETPTLTFDEMRKQRQQKERTQSFSNIKKATKKKLKSKNHNQSGRSTFQFKIGLQVGTALGECYMQVQKLENSMDKLLTVSEDVSDVLQYLHDNNIGTYEENYKPLSKDMKRGKQDSNASLPLVDNPLEEVSILNENLIEWQRDSLMRMQAMSSSVHHLQNKLEELDQHHVQAQNLLQMNNNRDIDEAYRTISELQKDVYKTKVLLQDKTLEIQRLKISKQRRKSNLESVAEQQARELELDRKENELDKDAELIAAQSEELRKESNRLLTEREEVRKQKEKWTKMIEEVKEQKTAQDDLFNVRHQQLVALKETLAQEQKKLYRKAKKIKAREKRLNQLRNNSQQNYVQTTNFINSSNGGSDYGAESELTYFSDGETAIESVNSISDDESQMDNYRKQPMQVNAHLGIPEHQRIY